MASTVSGDGFAGFSDGPSPRYSFPGALALDAAQGVVLLADAGNRVIRTVAIGNGTAWSVSSAGLPALRTVLGLALNVGGASSSSLLLTDCDGASADGAGGWTYNAEGRLGSLRIPGGGGGALVNASAAACPAGVALRGAGAALLTDVRAHTLAAVDLTTGVGGRLAGLSGVAGNADGVGTAARFHSPYAVVASADGALAFVADTANHAVRLVHNAGGPAAAVTALAGKNAPSGAGFADGVGSGAAFNAPRGLALSPDGAIVFVADTLNHAMRGVAVTTGVVWTVVGGGVRSACSEAAVLATTCGAGFANGAGALFNRPLGLAFEAGVGGGGAFSLLVADGSNHALRRVSCAPPSPTATATASPSPTPSLTRSPSGTRAPATPSPTPRPPWTRWATACRSERLIGALGGGLVGKPGASARVAALDGPRDGAAIADGVMLLPAADLGVLYVLAGAGGKTVTAVNLTDGTVSPAFDLSFGGFPGTLVSLARGEGLGYALVGLDKDAPGTLVGIPREGAWVPLPIVEPPGFFFACDGLFTFCANVVAEAPPPHAGAAPPAAAAFWVTDATCVHRVVCSKSSLTCAVHATLGNCTLSASSGAELAQGDPGDTLFFGPMALVVAPELDALFVIEAVRVVKVLLSDPSWAYLIAGGGVTGAIEGVGGGVLLDYARAGAVEPGGGALLVLEGHTRGGAVRRLPLDGYSPTATLFGGCADADACGEGPSAAGGGCVAFDARDLAVVPLSSVGAWAGGGGTGLLAFVLERDRLVGGTGSGAVRALAGWCGESAAATYGRGRGAAVGAPAGLAAAPAIFPAAPTLAGGTFFADGGAHSVRWAAPGGAHVATLAGWSPGVAVYAQAPPPADWLDGTPATSARFSSPGGLALHVPGGALFVADTGNARVRVVLLAADGGRGAVATLAGAGAGCALGGGGGGGAPPLPAAAACFRAPAALALDAGAGALFVADARAHAVFGLAFSAPAGGGAPGGGWRAAPPLTRTWVLAGRPGTAGYASVPPPGTLLSAPSGLALLTDAGGGGGATLLVADTGSAVLRGLRLPWGAANGTVGEVATLAGAEGSRGWADGPGGDSGGARFSAPGPLASAALWDGPTGAAVFVGDGEGPNSTLRVVVGLPVSWAARGGGSGPTGEGFADFFAAGGGAGGVAVATLLGSPLLAPGAPLGRDGEADDCVFPLGDGFAWGDPGVGSPATLCAGGVRGGLAVEGGGGSGGALLFSDACAARLRRVSFSLPPSASPTRSATRSASPTFTASPTATGSLTPSITRPSVSNTGSRTPTVGFTYSNTPSACGTGSGTPTGSATGTPSPSLTAPLTAPPTASLTASPTASPTASLTPRAAPWAGWAAACASGALLSGTAPRGVAAVPPAFPPAPPLAGGALFSDGNAIRWAAPGGAWGVTLAGDAFSSLISSRTATVTRSGSRTGTLTRTSSATPTPSETGTPSSTASSSQSGTETASPTGTMTQTGSSTASGTGSRTESGTGSGTRSGTATPTPSAGASDSNTGSPSDSPSPSATASGTGTPTATLTGTRTASASASLSSSITRSLSATRSPSSSATPTKTATVTLTGTRTASAPPAAPVWPDGAGTAAAFNGPTGLALNETSGALFVADTGNGLVRVVMLQEGSGTGVAAGGGWDGSANVSTFAGGSASLFLLAPTALALDAAPPTLYVADTDAHVVWAMALAVGGSGGGGSGGGGAPPALGTAWVLVGSSGVGGYANGAPPHALLRSPSGLLLLPDDGAGGGGRTLLISDGGNAVLRGARLPLRGSASVNEVVTVAGVAGVFGWADGTGGEGGGARFSAPGALAGGVFWGGGGGAVVFVGDGVGANSTLRVLLGVPTAWSGGGGGGRGAFGPFFSPNGTSFNATRVATLLGAPFTDANGGVAPALDEGADGGTPSAPACVGAAAGAPSASLCAGGSRGGLALEGGAPSLGAPGGVLIFSDTCGARLRRVNFSFPASATPTATPSRTATASVTPTLTTTRSPSGSGTPSVTPTISQSPTATATALPTPPPSRSVNATVVPGPPSDTVTVSLLLTPPPGGALTLGQLPRAVLAAVEAAVARAFGVAPAYVTATAEYVYADELGGSGGGGDFGVAARARAGVRVPVTVPVPALLSANRFSVAPPAGGARALRRLAATVDPTTLLAAVNATLAGALAAIAYELAGCAPLAAALGAASYSDLAARLALDPTRPPVFTAAVGGARSGALPGSADEALALAANASFTALAAGVAAGVACVLSAVCFVWWCRSAGKRKSRTDPGLEHLRASAAAGDARGGGKEKSTGTTKGATTELAPSWKVKERGKGSATGAGTSMFTRKR
jgi:hypothetical protein